MMPKGLPGNFLSGSRCRFYLFLALVPALCLQLNAQDPRRFRTEIEDLAKKYDSIWKPDQATVVFTGSSSIRLWSGLDSVFSKKQIVNTGFGGSQATDLLYYLDVLVLKYQPEQVFIYEGDNDLFEKKRPGQVLSTLEEITREIQARFPGIPLVLISAKPSISRWRLRGKYRRFNRRLQKMTIENDLLYFADVWNPMLNGKKLDPSLFIEDGLHMNQKGYTIWARTLKPFFDLNTQNNTRKP
ncbi:GDSL-type esterase/lipase family protein [Robiginitalea sp. IMCC44478]|uniref:GDSL-type esterase/lipase family protein n=1 Tax=Robiginitalea sp. IMCC44478 TaxID=3459122 RepID=UPI004042E66E